MNIKVVLFMYNVFNQCLAQYPPPPPTLLMWGVISFSMSAKCDLRIRDKKKKKNNVRKVFNRDLSSKAGLLCWHFHACILYECKCARRLSFKHVQIGIHSSRIRIALQHFEVGCRIQNTTINRLRKQCHYCSKISSAFTKSERAN